MNLRQVGFRHSLTDTYRIGWVERPVFAGDMVTFKNDPDQWWTVEVVYPAQVERDNLHPIYQLKGYWCG